MKSFLLLMVMIITIHTNIFSQSKPPELTAANYEERAQGETEAMAAKLMVTGKQKDSLQAINKDFHWGIVRLREQRLSISQRGEKLKLIEYEWKERLRNNLSTHQFDSYFLEKAQQRARMQQLADSLKTANQIQHHQ
jgi:hypothetical protein